MAMPQRDETIEEIKRLDALLEYAVMHDDEAEAERLREEPYNPGLAGVFFKCGLIEAWGRGFDKITAGCKEYGGPRPSYKIGESGYGAVQGVPRISGIEKRMN